jgi:hypothetical protein
MLNGGGGGGVLGALDLLYPLWDFTLHERDVFNRCLSVLYSVQSPSVFLFQSSVPFNEWTVNELYFPIGH